MLKPHCDNCDALLGPDASDTRRVDIQPLGFNCRVTLVIRKVSEELILELCGPCLRAAATGFAAPIERA